MADFKDTLIGRVRQALAPGAITEQRMFGGVCFMLNGNMLVGASSRGLMVRTGKDAYEAALARPHAEPMRQTTRVMPGYVTVAPEGVASDDDLRAWLAMALDFVGTLPAKSGKKPPARPRKPTTAPQRSRA